MTDRLPWACPACRVALNAEFACKVCGAAFPRLADGRPDFRPTGRITLTHTWEYDPEFGRFPWERTHTEWPDAGHDVRGEPSWEGTERAMIRAIPRAPRDGTPLLALDIGCGENRQRFRDGLVALGYRTLGLDIAGPAPDALADAHRLPLLDASVDLIVTSAVWEHLKHPYIAMCEAGRVAKPGALFVGSVAFGEPFHISYFHHSPLAIYELAISAGFQVESVVLPDSYSAFFAHLEMGAIGMRIPRVLHGTVANAVRWLFLFPAALRGRKRLGDARLAFARSHAAAVGVVAIRSRV
jgi:SAM-dependent methyltransferase